MQLKHKSCTSIANTTHSDSGSIGACENDAFRTALGTFVLFTYSCRGGITRQDKKIVPPSKRLTRVCTTSPTCAHCTFFLYPSLQAQEEVVASGASCVLTCVQLNSSKTANVQGVYFEDIRLRQKQLL
jgi:hypothetical protein